MSGDLPLSIEELEAGLLSLDWDNLDLNAFWDSNIFSFRQTVLVAIRDTSDALLEPKIPRRWRLELQGQLEELVRYIDLADRYIEARFPEVADPGPTTH
jgi:hypothetical protein